MFYELVQKCLDDEKNQTRNSRFQLFKIHYSDVPGRGQRWIDETKKGLPSEDAWRQEFECEFLNIGDAAIDEELFKQMIEKTSAPKFSFDEGTYKIWHEPDPTRVYVAGVDIGEGIG